MVKKLLCNARDTGPDPAGMIPHAAEQLSPQHGYWADALEPGSRQLRSPGAASAEARVPKAVLCNRRSHGIEKPAHSRSESNPTRRTRESLRQHPRPSTARAKI